MEILQFWAAAYYRLGASLRQYLTDLDGYIKEHGSEAILPAHLRDGIRSDVDDFEFYVAPVSRVCADALVRLRLELNSKGPVSARYVHGELQAFSGYIVTELNNVLFLRIPKDMATLHTEPLGPWCEKSRMAFTSAMDDMSAASECLALGQPTACVFHSMRVLERGLHAYAKQLTGKDFSRDQWDNITDFLAAEVKRQINLMSKGPEKEAFQQFHSAAVTQFQHFNEAWRKHVAHARRNYDLNEAKAVFEHACSFIGHIADRVYE